MKHIILAGDSIFDNQSYVNPGEPDVIKQLESLVAKGDKATLLAVDGAVITNVAGQLKNTMLSFCQAIMKTWLK